FWGRRELAQGLEDPPQGYLIVRAAQPAGSENNHFDVTSQTETLSLSWCGLAVALRFRAVDRLQQGRGPHAVAFVPGQEHWLVERERPVEHPLRSGQEREGRQGIAGQMLPASDRHRLGEDQAPRPKGLLGHLEAVERGIVRVKLVVEWHLLLEF